MLSRTANDLFWMSRHVERAENTARMLDVTHRMALLPYRIVEIDEKWAEPWALPLVITGLATDFYEHYEGISPTGDSFYGLRCEQPLVDLLAPANCARERARAARCDHV